MPNRILKESTRSSPNLAVVSDAAERLWGRLIVSVDDFGRFDGDPEVILAVCFQRRPKGWSIARVQSALRELAQAPSAGDMPLIVKYEVQGRPYIQIAKAALHIHRRAEKSRYPEPTEENCVPHAVASNCTQPHANAALNVNGNGNDSGSAGLPLLPKTRISQELPESWTFNERHQALAAGLGLNVHMEAAKFRDHHAARGTRFKCWDAAFRTWLNKAQEFKK